MALLRSYLFAPGNDEKLLGKVFEAGADAVVLDLEDAVPGSEKPVARERVRQALAGRARGAGPAVYVRINDPEGPLWPDDLEAIVCSALTGIRVPKAESGDAIGRVVDLLARCEQAAGLPVGGIELACTIETARGVLAAYELAGGPRVRNLCFGAADFARDVGAEPGDDESETLYARSRLVVASRAAGIDPPIASVHTRLDDEEGMRRSSEAARCLGFFGRSLIHPRQIAVAHEVFTPKPEELARAELIVAAYQRAAEARSGAIALPDGQFVDLAVVRRALALLALARVLPRKQEVATS